jgi:hypothetical protein
MTFIISDPNAPARGTLKTCCTQLGYTFDSFAPAQLALRANLSVSLSRACPGARLSKKRHTVALSN